MSKYITVLVSKVPLCQGPVLVFSLLGIRPHSRKWAKIHLLLHCSHYLLNHLPTVETSHPHHVKFVFHKSGLWCWKVGDHSSMCFQNNLMIFFFPTKHTTFRSFLGISIARNAGAEPLVSQFQYMWPDSLET